MAEIQVSNGVGHKAQTRDEAQQEGFDRLAGIFCGCFEERLPIRLLEFLAQAGNLDGRMLGARHIGVAREVRGMPGERDELKGQGTRICIVCQQ